MKKKWSERQRRRLEQPIEEMETDNRRESEINAETESEKRKKTK
jgi:hypothetical protein